MRYEIFYDPITHIVFDDFFTDLEYEKILSCIKHFEPMMYQGEVLKLDVETNIVHRTNDIKLQTKKAKNIWPYNYYSVDSKAKEFCDILERVIWSKEMREVYLQCKDSAFHYFNEVNSSQFLVSKYEKGDFYEWHKDVLIGFAPTGNIWISEDVVDGGNLVITNSYGHQKEIKYKTNRLILFPSRSIHKVTEVLNECKRFSIQYFSLLVEEDKKQ
jgi:hypothetical protein